MSPSIPLKRCNDCGQEFPATTEYFARRYGDKLRSRCRICDYEKVRQWRKANPEKSREGGRRRYKANLEKGREQRRHWREANPEKFRECCQRYSKANPEKHRAAQHRRRARKLAVGGSYTTEDIQRQLKMQTDRKGVIRCWWCNEPLGDDQSTDHRIPLSKGGSNAARNIVIAHLRCNQSKGAKLPHEWNGRLL